MQLLSNELKAVAVMSDLSQSGTSVTRDACMSVEDFRYSCARKRDWDGKMYGSTEPVMLSFSVRINAADQAQPFYAQLASEESSVLSFMFNATFSNTKRLSTYDEAIAVDGYIVDVEEDYHSAALSEQTEEQMILRARMLVRSINYLAEGGNKTLTFIQD